VSGRRESPASVTRRPGSWWSGWKALLDTLSDLGWTVPRPLPSFGHGAEVPLVSPEGAGAVLLGCFHVSQQNTFTGRLTPSMLDDVLRRAVTVAEAGA